MEHLIHVYIELTDDKGHSIGSIHGKFETKKEAAAALREWVKLRDSIAKTVAKLGTPS